MFTLTRGMRGRYRQSGSSMFSCTHPREPFLVRVPQAYKEIEAKYVTENVFSQFCYKTLPNPSHLWLFKKQLCMQMALSGAGSSPRVPPYVGRSAHGYTASVIMFAATVTTQFGGSLLRMHHSYASTAACC